MKCYYCVPRKTKSNLSKARIHTRRRRRSSTGSRQSGMKNKKKEISMIETYSPNYSFSPLANSTTTYLNGYYNQNNIGSNNVGVLPSINENYMSHQFNGLNRKYMTIGTELHNNLPKFDPIRFYNNNNNNSFGIGSNVLDRQMDKRKRRKVNKLKLIKIILIRLMWTQFS